MGSGRVTISQLLGRVWLVLAYSAVFEFPLTAVEVLKRFWRFEGETLPTQLQIEKSLILLRSLGKVSLTEKLWHLVSQPQAPSNRTHWEQYSQQKMEQATPVVKFLVSLPWVMGVAITGSVAVNSAKKDDDVDFMIVTEPNRLWLTRLLTLFFAMKHGKRRSFAKEEPNSWCFNLWITTNAMAVPREKQTLYTAYEVCQAKWILSRKQTAIKFLQSNLWVEKRIPHYYTWRIAQSISHISPPTAQEITGLFSLNFIFAPIIGVVDWLVYLMQLQYMSPHRTSEKIARNWAYFHPRNIRSDLNKKLEYEIKDLL